MPPSRRGLRGWGKIIPKFPSQVTGREFGTKLSLYGLWDLLELSFSPFIPNPLARKEHVMSNLFGWLAGDRRCAQRRYLSVPLRYRIRNSAAEFSSQTENISEVGVYFETEQPIRIGAILDVLLDMPNTFSRGLASLWCTGHVVRVASRGKKQGIGVQFDCFEIVDAKQFTYDSASAVS